MKTIELVCTICSKTRSSKSY